MNIHLLNFVSSTDLQKYKKPSTPKFLLVLYISSGIWSIYFDLRWYFYL